MDKHRPLKETFDFPQEIENLWIRFLEKAATSNELPIANKVTSYLMSADIHSIRDLLRRSLSDLSKIKRLETGHEETLLRILHRIDEDRDAFLLKCDSGIIRKVDLSGEE